MKNIIFIFICLLSVYTPAQILHTDDKNVNVFYEIEQTEKFVLCEGNPYSDENFSKEKIYIWKITFGIENGYSSSIVPRGVGIATISVSPNPTKPYSHNYCDYKYLENYEPNSIQRHLDQSLFIWAIRDHKVEEIKPAEVIKTITYLYLYEGQTPKLTNWQFSGYRLKKDFKSYDPILNDIVSDSKPVTYSDDEKKEKAKNLEYKHIDEIDSVTIPMVKVDKISLSHVKKTSSDLIRANTKDEKTITNKQIEPVKEKIDEVNLNTSDIVSVDVIPVKEIKPANDETVDTSLNTAKVASSDAIPTKKIKATKKDENKTDKEVIVDKQNEPAKIANVPVKCPGKKALEYKEMSSNASDIDEQKAYSWLALYYTYKCECEMGSPRSDQLVPVINNVVDSYTTNTNDAFGKILKVTKCTPPTINQ